MKNLILDAQKLVRTLIENGLADTDSLMKIANTLISKYQITKDQALFVIDNVIKTV